MKGITNSAYVQKVEFVQEQADWDETNAQSVTYIKNKPSELAPTAHASTHASDGDDPITPASIGAKPNFSENTAFNKNFGNSAGTVCEGNDERLSDQREPTAHATTHASGGSDALTPSAIGAKPDFTENTAFNKNFGTSTPASPTIVGSVGSDNVVPHGNHAHPSETFTLQNIEVTTSGWSQDTTYSDYPYRYTVTNANITASHTPMVIFDYETSLSGNIYHGCDTASGVLYIYATSIPQGAITIETAVFTKVI